MLLRAVHAMKLELRLRRDLLETGAGGSQCGLVLGRDGQVAAEAEGGVPLGQLGLPAGRRLVLVARGGR